MFSKLQENIRNNLRLKHFVLNLMVHPVKTRPRLWLRMLRCFYLKRHSRSFIYRSVRQDLVPFNAFVLGKKSVIESFSTLNNMVGDIIIGAESRIGLGNTIIGPVHIGNQVNIAQNVTVSGLNHNYADPGQSIISQGVSTSAIRIEDDVWIGANSVIVAGVTIGRHAIIAAGSVVTRPVPAFSIAAGNPARVIKHYDFNRKAWIKNSE